MVKTIPVLYNKEVISAEAKLCDTLPSKLLGLMFSKPKAAVLKADDESIIDTSIHTCFMRFPLDVIWLSKDLKIVDFRKNIRPFRMLIAPKKKAMYVVEVPSSKSLKPAIGEKVKLLL